MSVVLIANWRAARQARNLAEALSSDPSIRAVARARAIADLNRREQALKQPRRLAEVVRLPVRGRQAYPGFPPAGWLVFDEDY